MPQSHAQVWLHIVFLTNDMFGIELVRANGRAFGPFVRLGIRIPSPLGWARQMPGPLARRVFCRGPLGR